MADWGKLGGLGNVEDRRGMGGAALGGGGLIGVLLLFAFNILSGNPPDVGSVLQQLQQGTGQQQQVDQGQFAGADQYEVFAGKVLGSNNQLWSGVLGQNGLTYSDPRLVLFRQATQSACGAATSAVGPHYCPADRTIYLDETFFDELRTRFGAQGGDVAEAYVIAHEVGHHVQNELGIMEQVQRAEQAEANELSIKLELQADCFAGIWANSVSKAGVLEPGEIREAIDAAEAVGDDRIQQSIEGRISPESWTHGSSEQRAQWFSTGFDSGNPGRCDTFRH
jgi:hypothetical protein